MQGRLRGAVTKATMATLGALVALALGAGSAQAAAPLIESAEVTGVGTTSATFEATINPNGALTRYRFEYGPEDCSTSSCTKVPAVEAQIPAGSSPVVVSPLTVEGLSPQTLYHFRLVTKNPTVSESPDRVFATYGASLEGLPDGRAYERASPVNKDGGDAQAQSSLVKAALAGDGITFGSTVGMPGGKGAGACRPTSLRATR